MAHRKEANAANSNLQKFITNEIYGLRVKTESTRADAEITPEEGSFKKKYTIASIQWREGKPDKQKGDRFGQEKRRHHRSPK